MIKSERLFPLVLILLSTAFLVLFYGDLFYKPNTHLFNVSGDAIKNYYTYAAHSKQANYIQFEQMNYPYGESFMYLDCHPLFTVIIKTIAKIWPGINNYTIGIINFLMLFSIALTALFTYLILIKFKVDKLLALIGAFSISMLAPQLIRITGHYALAYSFAIPLSWFLYIKFRQSERKFKWSLFFMANAIAWYFIHGYMGMIIVSFILLTFIFNFIFERRKIFSLKEWSYLIVQTIIPLVVFWLFIKMTDTHTGRNDQPYGILTYVANWQSIFLPSFPPLRNFYGNYINIQTNWEGWTYVGIASVLFIFIFLLNSLLRIFRLNFIKDNTFNKNRILLSSLLSSIILLLLSMGYPFKLNMEYLLDWFPVINNFRGIARFSWPFYYAITIGAVTYFSLLIKPNKYRVLIFSLVALLPLSFVWEGISYHQTVRKKMKGNPNLFNEKFLPDSYRQGLNFADSSKYQTLIPLPFYHIGNEDFKVIGTNKSYVTSMVISYHSGLPIMGNYSTNTSIIESKNLIQLLTPNCYSKNVFYDISSKKPFLVICTNEELDKYETELLLKCEKIFACGDFSLYSISYEKLLMKDSKERISHFNSIRNRLKEKNGFLITAVDTSTFLLYDSFEKGNSDKAYRGKLGIQGALKNYTQIATMNRSKLTIDKEYEVSFWAYNEGEKFGQGALSSLAFVQTKDKSGALKWITTVNPARSVVIDDSWSLVELSFKMPPEIVELSVYVKGDNKSEKTIYIDDLLIKEKDADIYKVISEKDGIVMELFENNYKVL